MKVYAPYCQDENVEKIYTDFEFEELFAEPTSIPVSAFTQFNGGHWGKYNDKPQAKTRWERTVKEEIDKLMVHDGESFPYMSMKVDAYGTATDGDDRPHLLDPMTKQWQLVDTGAVVCVWPIRDYPDAVCTPHMLLEAVNGSRLSTFGKRVRAIKIGRKTYNQEVILADVKSPILGWNFIKEYKLSLIWTDANETQMDIVDKRSNVTQRLRLGAAEPGTLLGLKVIASIVPETGKPEVQFRTFQQWSQSQIVKNPQKTSPVPEAYGNLLQKFPDITSYDFTTAKAKHGVMHHIDTGDSLPCRAKARPIMPGSPKAIQGEKAWNELDKLGIVERVGPHETTNWSSAIHLQPKPDGSLRPCGDFRGLNHKTVLDKYPLPNIKHFNSKMMGAKIFSKVDLVKAFHAIPLDETSQNKTVVVTPWGTFKFKRLPMGLKNSPQTFQKLMDSVLVGINNCFAILHTWTTFWCTQRRKKTTSKLWRRYSQG